MGVQCSLYLPSGELVGQGECDLREPNLAVVEMPRARLAPVPGEGPLSLILNDGRSFPAIVRTVHTIAPGPSGGGREQYELEIVAQKREKERRGIAGAVRSLFGRG